MPGHDLQYESRQRTNRQQSATGKLRPRSGILCSSTWTILAAAAFGPPRIACRSRHLYGPAGYKPDGFLCQQQSGLDPNTQLRDVLWNTSSANQWCCNDHATSFCECAPRIALRYHLAAYAESFL